MEQLWVISKRTAASKTNHTIKPRDTTFTSVLYLPTTAHKLNTKPLRVCIYFFKVIMCRFHYVKPSLKAKDQCSRVFPGFTLICLNQDFQPRATSTLGKVKNKRQTSSHKLLHQLCSNLWLIFLHIASTFLSLNVLGFFCAYFSTPTSWVCGGRHFGSFLQQPKTTVQLLRL